jgi:hypothetical protein
MMRLVIALLDPKRQSNDSRPKIQSCSAKLPVHRRKKPVAAVVAIEDLTARKIEDDLDLKAALRALTPPRRASAVYPWPAIASSRLQLLTLTQAR